MFWRVARIFTCRPTKLFGSFKKKNSSVDFVELSPKLSPIRIMTAVALLVIILFSSLGSSSYVVTSSWLGQSECHSGSNRKPDTVTGVEAPCKTGMLRPCSFKAASSYTLECVENYKMLYSVLNTTVLEAFWASNNMCQGAPSWFASTAINRCFTNGSNGTTNHLVYSANSMSSAQDFTLNAYRYPNCTSSYYSQEPSFGCEGSDSTSHNIWFFNLIESNHKF